MLDHDVLSALVLYLDQAPFPMSLQGSINFHQWGQERLDDKSQIIATFVVYGAGSFLPIQLIYKRKSKRCLPKFTFPSNFHITFTPNHWSNLEKCEDLFKVIIFLRQKERAWPPRRPALLDYYGYFQRSRQQRNETIMCKE